MKEILIDNIICKIGKNVNENWILLDNAKETHLFFHLTSFPSCYVILEIEKEPSLEIIYKTALECKINTKYKNLKNIKIDYCLISNLIKGDKIGEVIYKSNRKVRNIKI
jgi:predicted ribosome quality control (RQC) complex YloA/Tae2 family protein